LAQILVHPEKVREIHRLGRTCVVWAFIVVWGSTQIYAMRYRDMFNPLAWLKVTKAHAHCDIPCGIYDPIAAKIAAQTVQKMVLRIQALEPVGPGGEPAARQDYVNKIARYVTVKEEHAEIVKKELRILWADFFNPTHLEANPDLPLIAGHIFHGNRNGDSPRGRRVGDTDDPAHLISAQIYLPEHGVRGNALGQPGGLIGHGNQIDHVSAGFPLARRNPHGAGC